MRFLDEIYRKKYGEDYSRDVTKGININDLTDYVAVKPLSECTGKTIKGVYNGSKEEIFIVFTDKTYIHISIEEDCYYSLNSCENFDYLIDTQYIKGGGHNYTPTSLCDLLEIDKDYVLKIQEEMDEAERLRDEEIEYRRYLELDRKYAARKANEEIK